MILCNCFNFLRRLQQVVVAQTTTDLFQLKDNQGLSCYQEQLWPECLRVCVARASQVVQW